MENSELMTMRDMLVDNIDSTIQLALDHQEQLTAYEKYETVVQKNGESTKG